MPTNFLSLPGEIREKIYEELLVVPDVIVLDFRQAPKAGAVKYLDINVDDGSLPRPHSNIIRLNNVTHKEASHMLYSRNRFKPGSDVSGLCDNECDIFTAFINQIGPANAGFLRSLDIEFPSFYNRRGEGMVLAPHSKSLLDLIRGKCTGIANLTLSLDHSISPVESKVVRSQIGAIPSLKEVQVIMYRGQHPPMMDEIMRNWGWTVEIASKRSNDMCGAWEHDGEDVYWM